ncbi:Hint domain-containing protein [Nereida sp. MMG025]|uniref:Hint domain-containing protein n=1 Tax=Nereida sp. MMG025 TaxID=2909981 RepID=UPI001F193495|nr:Hint domain-containing protein [Nereida sp. MMG025]MCF6445638.1 Hint domain-containing protein [Nereida sp. MMG025]
MPTFTIVAAGTDPLGPNEIAAGTDIQVTDGDIFIIDASANSNVTFKADSGIPADFDIIFQSSNTNAFNIKVEGNLTSTVDVAANSDLAGINLDAKSSDGLTMTAADGVSFGQFDGSTLGSNDVTIGNGFTTTRNWTFGDNSDSLIVGDDATFANIDTRAGDDTIEFGDRATIQSIATKEGNDSLTIGDDADSGNISTGKGDDTITTGRNAQITAIDGGEDNDSHTTQTLGMNTSNIETTTTCYNAGTMIDTPDGPRAVETLRPGDLVLTADHGPQEIRWVRSSDQLLEDVDFDGKPVLIAAGALGKGLPAQDLIVSPQHRILVGGDGQLTRYFDGKAFAPAKALTKLPGIRHMKGKSKITWVHFACDRHEVVTANGCLSESLLLAPMFAYGLTREERRTLTAIFGPVMQPGAAFNGPAAHTCLKVGEVRHQISSGATAKYTSAIAKEIRKWDVGAAMKRYEAERLRVDVRAKQKRETAAA